MSTATFTVPSVSTTSITADHWAIVITRRGEPTRIPVGPRTEAESLAAEIRGALADAFHAGRYEALGMDDEPAPAPTGKADTTGLGISPPDPEYDIDYWTVSGDLRPAGSGYSSEANYDARDALANAFPSITFDPESSCFYAYAKTEVEAVGLVAAILDWATAPEKGT